MICRAVRSLRNKDPALTEAFDNDRIKKTLQEILIMADGHYSILEGTAGNALYLPDHVINMQYNLKILDNTNSQTMTCADYFGHPSRLFKRKRAEGVTEIGYHAVLPSSHITLGTA